MSKREAFGVLDRAWELGIRAFDTAEAYGDAIPRLADWVRGRGVARDALVVTKARIDRRKMLASRVDAATRSFADVGELILLTHGAASDDEWEAFASTARATSLLGQSVYNATEMRRALTAPGVALLQAPANVLDLSAVTARGDHSVRLDVRSVYLQGLLLDEPALAEHRVPGAGRIAVAVRHAAEQVATDSLASLLVAAVLHATDQDTRVVVGVDTPGQLAGLAAAADLDPTVVARFRTLVTGVVGEIDPRILDPRQWVAPP